jgi:small subunit ribosomal protein S2
MMTNYKTIKASIKRLKDLEFLAEENFTQFGKKEALMMTREMEKLERSLGGIKDLGGIPDVVFVIDIGHEKNAIKEAQKLHLPLIGIVDTNHNPEGIDYVIPGNDDSIRAIGFYAREIANAILEAKAAAGTQTKAAPAKKTSAKKPAAKKEEAKTEAVTPKETPKEAPAKKAVAEKAPAEAEKLNKTALNAMKKAELVDYASTQDVKVNASDTKAQMIEKLT